MTTKKYLEYREQSWEINYQYTSFGYQTNFKVISQKTGEVTFTGLDFGPHTYRLATYKIPNSFNLYWLVYIPGFKYWTGIGLGQDYNPASLQIWREVHDENDQYLHLLPLLEILTLRKRRHLEQFLRSMLEDIQQGKADPDILTYMV